MNRRRCLIHVLQAVGFAAVLSGGEGPLTRVSQLAAAPNDPPVSKEKLPLLKNGEVERIDNEGEPTFAEVRVGEPMRMRATFDLPADVKLPSRLLIQIGVPKADGRLIIFAQKSGVPVRLESGQHCVEVELQGLQRPGRYTVEAVSERLVFAKTHVIVLPARK